MTCSDIQRQLTAYLDGELADDRGSAVRGHLRSCADCRKVAADEGALRDGLRDLAPVDPPPSLWANVQAQLASAEVADAQKPAWRRALARWTARATSSWPQLALGGAAAAAVVTFVVWRSHGSEAEVPVKAATHDVVPAAVQPPVEASSGADVTADLAGETARVTETYADAAEDLLALATEARVQWTADQRDAFDRHVAELRSAIDVAPEGRAKQTAWRGLIRYLQNAAVRDEVALASGGAQ